MGCAGCLLNEREQQEEINRITKEAKKYAVDNNKMVVIYFLDDRNVGFMEFTIAQQNGIIPIKYISQYQ